MHKIIILEDEYSEKYNLGEICNRWPDEIEVLSVTDEKRAIRYIRERQIDLLICDLASGYGPQLSNLSNLAYRYPYIPSIGIINPDQHIHDDVLNVGASACFEAPVNSADLRIKVHHLLEEANSGTVRGIPVHSLLQMFEGDEKTCTLKVSSQGNTGYIFMQGGVPVGAETEEYINDDAMYSIITWDDATVEIKHYNGQRPVEIQQSLLALIMEAFRLKDERDSLAGKEEEKSKPKIELKHLSTAGNRISLEVGAKVKMEFDNIDTPLVSTMVGMIPNQYVIVTTPQPYDLVLDALDTDDRIVVKYLHMGRLCMFKTKLLEAIEKPNNLLFLKYPPIIHFHELRRAKRTNIFVPATLGHHEGEELTGVLIDLSHMGCLYLSKIRGNTVIPSFDIDSDVQLNCLLPGVEENQILNGVVKNIKKSSSELRVGIEFHGLPDHLKDMIANYVMSVESISK